MTIEKVNDNQIKLTSKVKIGSKAAVTLNAIAVAEMQSSYELADVSGMGLMRPNQTVLTKAMAQEMLSGEDVSHDYAMNTNKKNDVYMDYVFGRCCKTTVAVKEGYVDVTISTVDRVPSKILALAKKKLTEFPNG